jgi:hypothetical protein
LNPAIKTPDTDLMTSTPDTPWLTEKIPMATKTEAKRLDFYTDILSSSWFNIGCNHNDGRDLNLCKTPHITPRHLSNHMSTTMGMGNEVGQDGDNPSHDGRDDEASLNMSLVHWETSHSKALKASRLRTIVAPAEFNSLVLWKHKIASDKDVDKDINSVLDAIISLKKRDESRKG